MLRPVRRGSHRLHRELVEWSLTTWGQRIFNGANGIRATAREATIFGGGPSGPPSSGPPSSGPPSSRPPSSSPPSSPPPGNRGCTATYFPEANALVSINNTAARSNTPVSKSVVISIAPSTETQSAVQKILRDGKAAR